jgi:hypothetical protein
MEKEEIFGLSLYGWKTNRLVASSKTNQFLKNEELTVEKEKK